MRRWVSPAPTFTGALIVVVGVAAAVFAAPSDEPSPTSTPGPSRPNILLVTLDTTRADVLGCYGGDPEVSPNLDRFAGRSHLFERCEASVPQTVPSHTTIFSGLHPFNHGVRKNLAVMVGPEVPLIADELAGRGYATAAFVSSFVVDPRFGFARGFDRYDAPDVRPRLGGGMERRAGETVRAAIDGIADLEGPWFVWVHLFDPHAPYEPPPPFSTRFGDRRYAGEVAYVDNEVGRLLGSLVAGDLFDRALVIVAGDHGEALGEHGEPTHGILLYEATTRVPLLVHMPGQTEAARHQGPVGLVDIAPTIREMIGIEGAADGVSLLPTLREKSKIAGDRALYIESLEGYLRNGWAPVFAVVRENWKYIDSPRPELYDLAADPGERHDLAAERPRVGADLARRLAAIRPSGESFAGPAITLSPDEEAALLALGYVTGAPGEAAGSRRNPADAIHLAAVHEQALEAKARGDLDEAVKLFKTELEQDPSSPVLLWYVGSCEAASNPDRAARRFRRAIELRPGFEAPYIALAELLLERGAAGQAAATATAGIGATFDADGRLHYLRAAAASPAGGGIDEVMRDLAIAIERAARPGPAYLLRAEIRLERLDDLDGALADLESFADWSTPQEVERLPTDPRFEKLHNEPRFGILVGRWLARADR